MRGDGSGFDELVRVAFQALAVGQSFTFRRTFTDGDVSVFCGVTGDYNPYHLDEVFARQSGFGRRIIPGLLTASLLTHIGGLLGFLATEMTFRYRKPVYIGDTIAVTVTITEKEEARRRVAGTARYVNQDGVEVLQALFSGSPSLVRLAR